MALTQPQAAQIAQLLGQYQDVARFIVEAAQTPHDTAAQIIARMNIPGNPLAGAVYGMTALSFVYTYDAVVKEQNFPAAIVDLVNLGQLNNPKPNDQGARGRPAETSAEACLRHLRNCFAHGRFVIHGTTNPQITLHDENPAGVATFDTQCDATIVFDLAERVLVKAHDIAAAIALGPPVPGAGPAGGPAPAPAKEVDKALRDLDAARRVAERAIKRLASLAKLAVWQWATGAIRDARGTRPAR
ncbi:MAG: hypothetical protein ACLQVI_22650 [Polyangiaceae bacterium]